MIKADRYSFYMTNKKTGEPIEIGRQAKKQIQGPSEASG
jgi:hypothetical protein